MSDESGMISTPPWLTGGAAQTPAPPVSAPMPPAPAVIGAPVAEPNPIGEATTIVQRGPSGWTLELADGRRIVVAGTVLVGRDPANSADWPSASLVAVNDPEKSVSKTHAAFVLTGGVLTVIDLHSTNGLAVVGHAGVVEVTASEPVALGNGFVVELGKYPITVEAG